MENGGQHTASVYKLESKTVGRLQDKLLTGTTVVGITACVSLCVQYRPTGPPIDVRCTTHGPFREPTVQTGMSKMFCNDLR